MKKLLLALAALTTVAATPAAAQSGSITVRIGDTHQQRYQDPYRYYQTYRYNPYSEQYRSYRGPLFLDRYGRYICVKRNGQPGMLVTRYGEPVTRYNAHRTYYGTYNPRVRCR